MTLRTRLTDTLARSGTAPSLLVVSGTRVGAALGDAVEGTLAEPTESHS